MKIEIILIIVCLFLLIAIIFPLVRWQEQAYEGPVGKTYGLIIFLAGVTITLWRGTKNLFSLERGNKKGIIFVFIWLIIGGAVIVITATNYLELK